MASNENGPWTLFQYGGDPLQHHYIDQEKKLAFTVEKCMQREEPNTVIRLVRDTAWIQQHPTVLGPDKSYFYLGPNNSLGYFVYGGKTTSLPMALMLRRGKKEGSLSRYWEAQNGDHYKWRVTSHQMECLDKRKTLALWELSSPEEDYHAKVTLYPTAMPQITEIMTTLTLNQMALGLTWKT